ncbi:MAG: ribonuclease J [Clostridia bacterium]|nr:ribonuclease J [Clostridia bacterium]
MIRRYDLAKRKFELLKKLRIIPLGGVGEIGKNMTVIEYDEDIIVVDCGMSFPDDEMLGVDLVIPDMTYLERKAANIRGLVVTHGHEDHIGAIPYLLKNINVPVYGTQLTLGLIEHKLNENNVENAQLTCVAPGDILRLGCFRIEFIKVNHSIAGAVALAITTPLGVVIHTGDFKLDYTPIDGEPMDLSRLAQYGAQGVLALMSDSTNVERIGYTQSEQELGRTFEKCFLQAEGRIIVATFASNIYRIQQVADVAIAHGRFICFQGRSMVQIAEMAMNMGYLSIPIECIVDVDKLRSIPDDKVCVITTGSQGEPMSGLFRMANATHKLNVGEGDTVIISATAIPGNEKGVAKVINQLFSRGVKVIYDQMADVHVSGHARREELKLMLALIKPKFFIPIHGEHRHLYQHAEIAASMGIPLENIFAVDCGDIVELTDTFGVIAGEVPSGAVLVDGFGVGDIGMSVLRDRRILSQDGLVTVVVAVHADTGMLSASPEIVTKGFVFVRDSEELIGGALKLISDRAEQFANVHRNDWPQLKNSMKQVLKSYLYDKTGRMPMILTILMETE